MRSFNIKDDKKSSTNQSSTSDVFVASDKGVQNDTNPSVATRHLPLHKGGLEKRDTKKAPLCKGGSDVGGGGLSLNSRECSTTASLAASKTNIRKQRYDVLRKYAVIVLCLLTMILTAVGFSKWNIHIQQTLTVDGNADAPLLGYVTENAENPESAILNRYLTVKHTTVDTNGNTTEQITEVKDIGDDSFTYNGKPFTVSLSAPNANDVAATWDDWDITFDRTYHAKAEANGKTTYPDAIYDDPANAGTYICVVTAKSKNEATVENGTAITKLNFLTNPVTNAKSSCAAVVEFTVNPEQITAPTAVEKVYTYTGNEQEFVLSIPSDCESLISITDNTATNAGDYTVTVSLNDTTNYVWKGISEADTANKDKNGTSNALTFDWTIQKDTIQKPTLKQNEFEYNASSQSVSLINFDESIMDYDSETTLSAKDVGSYNVIVKLTNANYKWSGETEPSKEDSPIVLTWKITKKTLTKPQATQTEYKYTGNTVTLSLSGFNGTYMSITGNTATDAGDYTAKINISDKNCVWADGTSDEVQIEWSIIQSATLTPTIAATKPTDLKDLYMEGEIIDVTVTVKNKDGNLADLGNLTLPEGSKSTITKIDTGTYKLSVYVLYNNGNPSESNTNVAFDLSTVLTFTSTNNDYVDTTYTTPSKSVTVKPVSYNKSTTKYYGTLNKALDTAVSGNAVYLIPGSFITVTETLTVTSGVTLYVPYDGETYINEDDDTLHGGNPIDTNETNVTTYRKSRIMLSGGANLIINSGASVYLGAITGTMGVYSYYTEITLDKTSHIQVHGSFYCYGYVKELNPVVSNTEAGDYQNANDSERYIEVSATGTLEVPMAMYYLPKGNKENSSHGGTLYTLNEKKICPINVFDFSTLQTYTKIICGGQMNARIHLYAYTSVGEKAVDECINIIRQTNSGETALFYIQSGYLALEYTPNGDYTTATQTTNIYLEGGISIGTLNLDLSVVKINTDNYALPFSYKLKIYALTTSNFEISKNIKLMPGSFIQINEGATVTISSHIAVHTSSNAKYLALYPTSGYSDAQFVNNGNLTLTSAGKFGGLLSTTQTTKNATCDFSAITSKDSFMVTVSEGNEATQVSYTAKGEFFDTTSNQSVMAYFVPQSTITSYGDGSRWQGEMNSTSTLTITKTKSNLVCDYEVWLADDESGTNATKVVADDGKTYLLTNNKYFMVKTYFCTNAVFTVAESNETFESGVYYQVSGDYTLVITGSETFTLYLSSVSKSGASNVVYTVYSADSENGEYRQINSLTNSGNTSLAKNSWFYVETSNVIFKEGEFKSPSEKEGTSYTCGDKCQITSNFSIELGSNSGCLVEGTLITLAGGSKKKVEDVTANDTLLIFNHETGKYDYAKVLFNDSESLADYTVINLKFNNGKTVKVVSEHGFFDLTLNKYVYVDEYNYKDYVGHKFYSATYNGITYNSTAVTLTNAYLTTERVRVYSPVTKYHLNYFTEDILSMPGGISGLFNIFEYGENLKYDEELKKADLELYGELTYDDFKDLVSLEMYESYPANYFAVAIGKGILSWDNINYYIERYAPLTESANDNSNNAASGGYSSGGVEESSSAPAAQEAAIIPSSATSKTKSSSDDSTDDDTL